MISVHTQPALTIDGVSRHECEALADLDPIRQAEVISIRRFIESQQHVFCGRVLDFGAGKLGTCRTPQPYRALIEGQCSEYLPYDLGDRLPNQAFDVILCTQVMQYVSEPELQLILFAAWLRQRAGTLVMTYPTNWSECEGADLWRFTRAGMERLLTRAGFRLTAHHMRAEVRMGAVTFPLGYGVVAVAL